MISRKLTSPGVLIAFCLSATAAEVALRGDNKLTGEVVSMDEKGTISLVSPISRMLLKVRGEQVEKVDFGNPETLSDIPDQRVELTNGDVLPLKIEELDGDVLKAVSPAMGSLEIPRKVVSSIQLGIVPERMVYSGPDGFGGWIRDVNGSRNWNATGESFVAEGQGTISRELNLPEKFIVRFKLSWRNHPNFRFSFADPLEKVGQRVDRYFLQFAGAGLEIKRESKGKDSNRYTPIVLLSRSPEQFPGNRVEIEIRVDRNRGLMHLYLDGELEGRYTDPIPDIPAGNGISLVSQAARESEQTVSEIEVLEWDDRGDRHRTEDRGDGKNDSLIGRFGERFGGTLTSVNPGEEGPVYLFKSDFQPAPIELPQEEVSTVFFANGRAAADLKDIEGVVLKLRGGGEIRASSCVFGEKTVKVTHPLLGSMEIDRGGVSSLERRDIPKAKAIESR